VSSNNCWAIGHYLLDSGEFNEQTLIEHWDGSSWSLVDSPNATSSTDNHLSGITCVSATECWAVGRYIEEVGNPRQDQTFVELWDGSSWSIATSANSSPDQPNGLNAVTCTSQSHCWAVGFFGNGQTLQALTEFIAPIQLTRVVSRKVHGTAGPFDVDLTTGSGIECRSGGAGGDYSLVFTFSNPLANVEGMRVDAGTADINNGGIGPNPNQYTVNLTGVAATQSVTVSLSNVTDSVGNFSVNVPISMTVLIGDTNGDAVVNSADIGQTKSQSGQRVTLSNFREDVNADGFINSADIGLVKSRSGTALP
jgi:hypothetical protein